MSDLFDPRNFTPEYVHVLLNHMLIEGLLLGVCGLIAGFVFRSRAARALALTIVFVSAAAAWPVAYSGDRGYDRISAISDEDGGAWLDAHEARADKVLPVFYLTALSAAASLALSGYRPKLSDLCAALVLALAAAAWAGGLWTAHAGGKIMHREFRHSPPPIIAESAEESSRSK